MSIGKVVLGTMAGLTIGAIGGILFAPKKGSKTRKDIMHKGDGYWHKLKTEKAKKSAEKEVEKAKGKYDDAKKEVKNMATEIKHSAS
ncbi:YtxH domain-containing protein [Natronoflexus pectinivorans]|uniref:YtxH-like protein n=1 Tax=Natronoflexus pectinivorans TaxID=682526 RepID=A0A4R2GP15_9BACT|nr:YtxH domain-containing protein [Natronoflexus pectinivorans]TCO11094.1 YtxH-like protein [Natronoflexus pectinivorans]